MQRGPLATGVRLIGQQGKADLDTRQLQAQPTACVDSGESVDVARAYGQHVGGHRRRVGQGQIGGRLLEGEVPIQGDEAEQVEIEAAEQLQQVPFIAVEIEVDVAAGPRRYTERSRCPVVGVFGFIRIYEVQDLVRVVRVAGPVHLQRERRNRQRQPGDPRQARAACTRLDRRVVDRVHLVADQHHRKLDAAQRDPHAGGAHARRDAGGSHRQIRRRRQLSAGRAVGHREVTGRLRECEITTQRDEAEQVEVDAARQLQQRALVTVHVEDDTAARARQHSQRSGRAIVGVFGVIRVDEVQDLVRIARVAGLVHHQQQRVRRQRQAGKPRQARAADARLDRRVVDRRVADQHHTQLDVGERDPHTASAQARRDAGSPYRQVIHRRQLTAGRAVGYREVTCRLLEGEITAQVEHPGHIHIQSGDSKGRRAVGDGRVKRVSDAAHRDRRGGRHRRSRARILNEDRPAGDREHRAQLDV